MVEKRRLLTLLSHAVMWLGVLLVAFPLYLAFVASTHLPQDIIQSPMPMLPGSHMWETYRDALLGTGRTGGSNAPVARMMWVSFVTAMVIAAGKIAISLLSAFAVVFFRFPLRQLCFWSIFITLMLPVEVRIVPTYKVVSDLGMLNSFAGLTIPLSPRPRLRSYSASSSSRYPMNWLKPHARMGQAPCGSSRTSCCHCPKRVWPLCS